MPLHGSFYPPGDKSISHRLVLFALAAKGNCLISHLSGCADVISSLAIYRRLGGKTENTADGLLIKGLGGDIASGPVDLNCGNSGTTIRLLCGILAGLKGEFTLDGDDMLRKRPMVRVTEPLKRMGAQIDGCLPPVRIRGSFLHAIDYNSPLASAQVKSAILLAGLKGDGLTVYREPVTSRNHTEILLRECGAELKIKENVISIVPGDIQLPAKFTVPGDASGAAFFLSAAAFIPGSDVTALNVSLNPGRIGFLSVLQRMGAGVDIVAQDCAPEAQGRVRVFYNGPLKAACINSEEIPALVDEVPILALVAAHARGTSIFRQVSELKVKEINRLAALHQQLGALGADIKIDGDDLLITGTGNSLQARKDILALDSFRDHRMAMTLALAVKAAGVVLPVKDARSAVISYPDFFSDLNLLWHD
ncbi:MAG: 3-phosphoshikimate 1-carboxyvinyltransferase [Desulfarculales bacterium]|jgi:3-phosphoshikimate 1-carboxyvinyltransferase|nr:3-phosphoshikimate 1-carboxyvinyltransferase [Desulfarculales bacterium]